MFVRNQINTALSWVGNIPTWYRTDPNTRFTILGFIPSFFAMNRGHEERRLGTYCQINNPSSSFKTWIASLYPAQISFTDHPNSVRRKGHVHELIHTFIASFLFHQTFHFSLISNLKTSQVANRIFNQITPFIPSSALPLASVHTVVWIPVIVKVVNWVLDEIKGENTFLKWGKELTSLLKTYLEAAWFVRFALLVISVNVEASKWKEAAVFGVLSYVRPEILIPLSFVYSLPLQWGYTAKASLDEAYGVVKAALHAHTLQKAYELFTEVTNYTFTGVPENKGPFEKLLRKIESAKEEISPQELLGLKALLRETLQTYLTTEVLTPLAEGTLDIDALPHEKTLREFFGPQGLCAQIISPEQAEMDVLRFSSVLFLMRLTKILSTSVVSQEEEEEHKQQDTEIKRQQINKQIQQLMLLEAPFFFEKKSSFFSFFNKPTFKLKNLGESVSRTEAFQNAQAEDLQAQDEEEQEPLTVKKFVQQDLFFASLKQAFTKLMEKQEAFQLIEDPYALVVLKEMEEFFSDSQNFSSLYTGLSKHRDWPPPSLVDSTRYEALREKMYSSPLPFSEWYTKRWTWEEVQNLNAREDELF